jgi:Lon protease-like protein
VSAHAPGPGGLGAHHAGAGELPMFPLGSVLFPGGLLPLHVFEPRYRALVERCLAADRELGVVLIERGSEVGGGDVRTHVGTRARIVDAAATDDGRFHLLCVGLQRIAVSRWLPDDPFPRAETVALPDPGGEPPAGARDAMERLLRRALALSAELGDPAAPATVDLDPDPAVAAWQAAIVAPMGPADAQRVLEAPSAADRVALLTEVLSDQVSLLALRVAER